MKKILLSLMVTFLSISSFGQNTIFELIERTDISTQEIERLAQKHFDEVGTGKGSGYKQFQRWLYERKFHLDEKGNYISPNTDWSNYLNRAPSASNLIEAGNWTELGPLTWNRTSSWNPGTGRLSALAIHPSNEQIIYAGSPGGGLWKTINGGSTWTPLMDNSAIWTQIFAITIDPVNQNTVYVGTNGSGLIKSLNGGTTWINTGSGPTGNIRKILIHPSAPNTVFACAGNGIFRSTNGGTNWTQVYSGGSKEDIEFKPDDMNIMYSTGSSFHRSVDNGVNWTLVGAAEGITNTGRTLVSVSAANSNYVYAVQASGSLFGRMYKSTDAGLTFTTTVVGNPGSGTNYFGYETNGTGTSGQATYDMAMDVSPTNAAEVYIAGIICWKSTNEATSFTAITAWSLPNSIGYNHADVHGLFWINNTLYSISDGGVYKSLNQGDDWIDITAGMGIRQFYRIANSQTNANVITGGAQDNGSVARQASGTWVDWLGADGMEGLVSPTNHLNIWGTSQNGSIYRSVNGGNSYSGLPKPSNGNWVTPLSIHPTNETILYGGWTGVYKSTNSGSAWTNISGGTITAMVTDLAVAPSNPNTIYATIGSTIYVTTDDGANWVTRTAPSTINDIIVDPTNPSKIWIACNSTSNRVLVSTDGGANFTNISFDLPTIVARTIAIDNNTPRGIYVGMNIGVFYQQDGATTWTNFSDNLPMVAINELEIQNAAGKIRVATYGRGVWESPLQTAAPSGFSFTTPAPAVANCPTPATMSITLLTSSIGGFTNPITLSATAGVPAGTNISFGTNPVTPGNSTIVNLNNANTLATGNYVVTITGVATATANQTVNLSFTVNPGTGPAISVQPIAQTLCAGGNTSFTITSPTATTYQWQLSTNGGANWSNIANGGVYSNATTSTLNITSTTAAMNTYQYRCIASMVCGTTNSNAVALAINTAPSISSQPVNVSSCAGNSETFSVAATGTGLTYQWQLSTDGGFIYNNLSNGAPYSNVTTATLTINPTTLGMNNYRYRCIVSGTCPSSQTSTGAILTVGSSLSITSQPANSTLCAGLNTSFAITTTGTVLSLQWQESTNGGGIWNNISNGGIYSGATTSTLSLTGVTVGMNNYQYRTVVTGSCSPINSNVGILTVNAAASISGQPSNATICGGNTTIFNVTAAGAGLSYQWQISTTGCAGTWTNLTNTAPYSGVTSSTLTISAASSTLNGNVYRCTVTGSCAPSVTSNCASLTVNTAVNITTQPSNAIVCATTNTTFTVAASGTTPSYQWQESTNGGGTWNNISNGGIYSGATTVSLTLTGITAGMNNNQYRAIVSGASPCGSSNSNAAILTVNTAPSISGQPTSAIVCGTSNSACYSVSASGTTITYQWQVNTSGCTGGVWTNLSNAVPYTGVTTATLCITNATTAMNAYGYRCVVSGTCTPNAISNCATLTVNTPVNISSQPSNTTVCAGTQTTFTVGATGTSPIYQWQESTNGGGTWNNVVNGGVYSGATTSILTLTGVTVGMNNFQYRNIVTGAATCGSATSAGGTLNVNTAPAITTQPVASTTICGGQNTSFNVIANGTALTYQWQVSTDAGVNYSNLSNTGVYTGVTTATLNITTATTGMGTYRYRCVISGTCTPSATSNAALLTVHTPLSVTTQPSAATICATGTISFSMAASGTGPTYQWQESTNGGTSWNNISNGGIYSGATSTTLTLTGVTSGMNGSLYRTTITGTVPCSILNTIAAVLTVSPRPTVSLSAAPYLNLLPNLTTTITASVTPSTGYTLAWTRNGSPISVAGNSHLVNVNGMGVYTVVATIGSCTSAQVSITIADSTSNNLYVFPSPNDGRFTVSYYSQGASTSNQTKQKINIFDSQGRRVYSNEFSISQPYQLHSIDLRRNGTGVYIVVLSDANGKRIKTARVVVR